ncbi:MAG: GNAT family N-acetyltransferase [Phycisphaeraceae bacterium]
MTRPAFHLVSFDEPLRRGVASLVHRLDQWFEPDALADIHEQLTPDTALLAVEADHPQTALGFITVRFEREDEGRITWMGVDPAWQRQGVGRALVESICAEARQAGLSRLWVETMSDQVDHAPFDQTRAFYASMGFTPHHELGDLAGNGLLTTDWALELQTRDAIAGFTG